ncbi:hypothetical protein Scep_009256 [Stephania cephalantha]|uniref:Uncharacterized protein n=1 Tax=Stephania cephalantha TaxID=152367 RepID=A0AAP0JV53_9MAGN
MESSNQELKVMVLEKSQVAPPPLLLTEASLFPLTYFDLPLLLIAPPEMLIFYKLPNVDISHFMDSILPQIKHSLSLTLQHFYPLAGNLIWSPEFNLPVISYVDGDSIPLTAVESSANFNHLSSYNTRDAKDFQHLIPQLNTLDNSNTSNKPVSSCAMQITLFPGSGICLGMINLHSIVDGRAVAMFLKSWASVSRLENASLISCDNSITPHLDRSVIKDVDNRLRKQYWQRLAEFIRSKSMSEEDCSNWLSLSMDLNVHCHQVVATFVLARNDIEKLRKLYWASMAGRPNNDKPYPSRFELACAYVWINIAKIPNQTTKNSSSVDDDDEMSAISFVADYRARLDPPMPPTYFGNCIWGIKISAKRRDIVSEDGITVAVNTVMREVRGLRDLDMNHEARLDRLLLSGNSLSRFDGISWSTQFGFYELDFGRGRPEKIELMSKARSMNSINFCDCGNGDDGGIEIGLVRDKNEVDAFALSFNNGLKDLID